MSEISNLFFPNSAEYVAKPFMKWAGGKSQLIPIIEKALPTKKIGNSQIAFVEPFIGSGAVFFQILKIFPQIKKAIINDINSELINAYIIIRDDPHSLLSELELMQKKYQSYKNELDRKEFFLEIRSKFNSKNSGELKSTAYLIFLNRTCYNGLYRVNRKNEFNVPFGNYKNPNIYNPENIMAVNRVLQKTEILNIDFEKTVNYVTEKSFFYFDPPYRPLTKTSSFNSYASNVFNDKEQKRLARFCKMLDEQGHYWLLSNSDPKNIDKSDNFFDSLYSEYNISRVNAKRMINSDSTKRGNIKELLISNYKT